jgi:hypothetical protein
VVLLHLVFGGTAQRSNLNPKGTARYRRPFRNFKRAASYTPLDNLEQRRMLLL